MLDHFLELYHGLVRAIRRFIDSEVDLPERDFYENMTKNELVRELWDRGIEHNKRQSKDELIDLLMGDDRHISWRTVR